MALFQDTDGDPRAAAAQLADVLAFYGAVGDAASGNPPGFAARKAAAGASIAQIAQLDDTTRDAVYFAGVLHAVGALGNPAYRKGEPLSERVARMERWDVPAQGARICDTIAALPADTADLVRWQAECWDGTGFPDQLRWHGIPLAAQLLAVADTFLRCADPDEALGEIGMQSGRAFGPEAARAFTMWFHVNAGEELQFEAPVEILHPGAGSIDALLDAIATRIDEHNGVPGRWQRIERLTQATAKALELSNEEQRALAVAVRVFGSGEVSAESVESSEFDPLSRLGIDDRARNANAAAALAAPHPSTAAAADILRARSEWFDGTGKPAGLRHDAIPRAAAILAATIAYDALEHANVPIRDGRRSAASRIDSAAGTQFAPRIVRALLDAAGAHA